MMVEMVPADPLCIFSDDVIDLLPDTYNAKAPMQQSTIARGATALAKAQTVTAEIKPLSFRRMKDNDELMIKVGAEAEPTFKGPAVEEFLKTYCRTTHCGPEFEQARQKRLAKMCWRVAHGLAAVENRAEADPYECPAISSTFERRMVTPHMKVQYQMKGGSFGTKKQQMGLELWWHGYGVAVRAGACTTARPCGLRYTVAMQRSNTPPLCPRCK